MQQAMECFNFTKEQLSILHSYPLENVASLKRPRNGFLTPEHSDGQQVSDDSSAQAAESNLQSKSLDCVPEDEDGAGKMGYSAGEESDQPLCERTHDGGHDDMSTDEMEDSTCQSDSQDAEEKHDEGQPRKRKDPDLVSILTWFTCS